MELIDEVKNYLDITYNDEETDRKLSGIVERGKAYLDSIAGKKQDYSKGGKANEVLIDYAMYVRAGSLEELQKNYKHELIELCKVVAAYHGFLGVHLRNEAGDFENSVQEAIDICKAAGCGLNLSHHKVCGSENWGKTKITLQMIKDAKAEGMEIYTDVYPYLATGNYLNICLPKEFFSNGPEKMAELLRDPAVRAEMKEKILNNPEGRYRNCGGFENIKICGAPFTPEAVGMTVSEYARSVGKDEF